MGTALSDCASAVQAAVSYVSGARLAAGICVDGVEYSAVRLIGEGGFSLVYEGVDGESGARVALKRYVLADSAEEARRASEVELHRSLCPHETVVRLLGSCVLRHAGGGAAPEMWIAMELCPGPSMQTYINAVITSGRRFTVGEFHELSAMMVAALRHLHEQSPPVAHWDVKPDNFIFSDSGRIKLCDFGSASRAYYLPVTPEQVAVAEAELGARMTFLYRAPETLNLWSRQRVDTKADVWALGVLLYTLIFLEMPFGEVALEIVDGVPRCVRFGQECDPLFAPVLDVVLTHMLVPEPAHRADIFTVDEKLSELRGGECAPPPAVSPHSQQTSRF